MIRYYNNDYMDMYDSLTQLYLKEYYTPYFILDLKNSYISLLPREIVKIIVEKSQMTYQPIKIQSYINFANEYLLRLMQITKYFKLINFENKYGLPIKYNNKIIEIIRKDEYGIICKIFLGDTVLHIKHGDNNGFYIYYEVKKPTRLLKFLTIQPLFAKNNE